MSARREAIPNSGGNRDRETHGDCVGQKIEEIFAISIFHEDGREKFNAYDHGEDIRPSISKGHKKEKSANEYPHDPKMHQDPATAK